MLGTRPCVKLFTHVILEIERVRIIVRLNAEHRFVLLQAFASASISFAASLFVAPRGTLSANRHVTERRSLIDRSEVRVCLSLKSTSQTTNIDNVRVSP